MGSEQSWSTTDTHKFCANGCGFFGTASTLNLCSKCYRDFKIKEEQETKAKAVVEKSFNPPPVPLAPSVVKAPSQEQKPQPSSSELQPLKNRCFCCKKRVGLTGFQCRCGSTFCGIHRYPETHSCTFDFKEMGCLAIAKSNPLVKADKVVDRI